jgi:hypothetical protein
MASVALHTALIWHDEVMHDLVADKPRRITLGRDGRSTFTVPELGLPPGFAILAPGNRGYVMTLGARMRGTICVDGKQHDVAALVAAGPDGFAATPISERDWGVIELDDSGHHKLFFQFVPVEEPVRVLARSVVMAAAVGTLVSSAALTLMWALKGVPLVEAAFRGAGIAVLALVIGGVVWSMLHKDGESMASLAFSVVLHTALLFMTYQVAVDDDPFSWPGLRSLAGDYLVTRLDRSEPPPVPVPAAKPATIAAEPPRAPPPTEPEPARDSEGGGPVEPAVVRNEPPPVQFMTRRNREVLAGIVARDLTPGLNAFIKLTRQGPGAGPGRGPGIGTDPLATTRGNPPGDRGPRNYQPGPRTLDVGPLRQTACVGPGCRGTAPRAVLDIQPSIGEIDGGLTQSEIDQVVKQRAPVFRACYQRELDHKAGLGGKLVVFFRIGGDGLVVPDRTTFVAGTTLQDDAVQRCVAGNINRLKFPARGGAANVKYPFVFAQGG